MWPILYTQPSNNNICLIYSLTNLFEHEYSSHLLHLTIPSNLISHYIDIQGILCDTASCYVNLNEKQAHTLRLHRVRTCRNTIHHHQRRRNGMGAIRGFMCCAWKFNNKNLVWSCERDGFSTIICASSDLSLLDKSKRNCRIAVFRVRKEEVWFATRLKLKESLMLTIAFRSAIVNIDIYVVKNRRLNGCMHTYMYDIE